MKTVCGCLRRLQVSREQAGAAKSRQFVEDRVASPAAAAAVRDDAVSPSQSRHRYSRRVDQQQTTATVYATQQQASATATAANRRPVGLCSGPAIGILI